VITPRTLYALAAAFALTGATLAVSPPPRPRVESPAAPFPDAPARRPSPASSDTVRYAGIAAADVFSDTRTPPAVRFTPDPTTDRPRHVPVARRVPADAPTVHLSGITVTPRGAIALVGNGMHRVGDHVGGGTITAITESTVVLERPQGPLVLRLPLPTRPRP
jgi:hypothetical protein